MARKLNWEYQTNAGEQHAKIGDNYRIRAVQDLNPSNPFTDGDQNWPIVVRVPDNRRNEFTTYVDGVEATGITVADLSFFDPSQLVHDQHAILKALGWGRNGATATSNMKDAFETYLTDEPVGYCTDPEILADLFHRVLEDNSDSVKLGQLAALFKLAGIHAYCTQVTGYSQGDWAEVLVVADKETIERFGSERRVAELRQEVLAEPATREVVQRLQADLVKIEAYVFDQVSERLLKSTADLYGWWAYGDVFGHIVEKRVIDEDEADPEADESEQWEELPDGACWGFYGPDHDESGLEESALQSVPDEELEDA